MKIFPRSLIIAGLAMAFARSASAAVETYTIDPVHSSVAFTIRHIVSKVAGKFAEFRGTISVDRANPANNAVNATINTASFNTGTEKRDHHVRSPDFLDAGKFPTIVFTSKSWKPTGGDTFEVSGDLTIKDVTKPVVLKVTSLGFSPGMMPGQTVSGWEATTTINKKDFHVDDPPMLDAAIGDDVNIVIDIEAGMMKRP